MAHCREFRFRLFVRRKLDRELSKQVLADREVCDACCEECCEQYDAYCENAQGPLQDFIEWMMANIDKIIAMIKKIIDLFMAK